VHLDFDLDLAFLTIDNPGLELFHFLWWELHDWVSLYIVVRPRSCW
jgi:hypothetical protein